jgi:Mrp family chromosome partitioning ATPase
MSSNNQAFVKAFARRRDVSVKAIDTATNVHNKSAGATTVTKRSRVGAEPGSLTVDETVAATTQVWLDSVDDQMARADHSVSSVPKPHLEPVPQPPQPQIWQSEIAPQVSQRGYYAPSLQHIHTAYATAYTDVAPVSLPQRIPTESERLPREIELPEEETVPSAVDPATVNTGIQPEVAAGTIVPFQSVWEVDVFDIPATVADLFFEGRLFQQIAERMSDAVATGLRTVLVTSNSSGEGRSSVAIGMAMAAAAAGIQVALVDTDTEDPTLADDLRLDLEYGWVDTIRGGLPIKEVAVHAVEDGVTLIPLMPPHGRTAATAYEVTQLIKLLQGKFELIVIDGPAGSSPCLHQCASVVDSAIIVRDMTRTNTLQINEFSSRLREAGVSGIGIVENFA